MSGGTEFLQQAPTSSGPKTKPFPGKGCVDYTLTVLTPRSEIEQKLLIKHKEIWCPIADLDLETLKSIDQKYLPDLTKSIIDFWINSKSS